MKKRKIFTAIIVVALLFSLTQTVLAEGENSFQCEESTIELRLYSSDYDSIESLIEVIELLQSVELFEEDACTHSMWRYELSESPKYGPDVNRCIWFYVYSKYWCDDVCKQLLSSSTTLHESYHTFVHAPPNLIFCSNCGYTR